MPINIKDSIESSTIKGSLNGNATTATRLQNPVNITINNVKRSFDGVTPISWSANDIGLGTGNFVLKTGDTMTGILRMENANYGPIVIKRTSGAAHFAGIRFENTAGELGSIGMGGVNTGLYRYHTNLNDRYLILDENNYRTVVTPANIGAVAKVGDTMSGNLTISRTTGDSKFHALRTDTNTGVWAGVGGNGVDHGLFSTRHNKWIVHANSNQVAINEFVVGSTGTRRWGIVPTINAGAGVMEIGAVLDFHLSNTNNTDYNARLQIFPDETFVFTKGIYPSGQDTHELGNANRRWRSAYFSGNVNAAAHVNNSERELKDDIQVFDSNEAYETVKKLNVYTYNYKERLDSGVEIKMDDDGNVIPNKDNKKKPKFNSHTHMGLIVDEAPKEIVSEDGTGIDIYGFTSYTASALKIAIQKIEKLEKLLNVTGTN